MNKNEIQKRLEKSENEVAKRMGLEASGKVLRDQLRLPGKVQFFEGFSDRVMLQIMNTKMKRVAMFTFLTNLLIASSVGLSFIALYAVSAGLGWFEYQTLNIIPLQSMSYILPGALVLIVLGTLDQTLLLSRVFRPSMSKVSW